MTDDLHARYFEGNAALEGIVADWTGFLANAADISIYHTPEWLLHVPVRRFPGFTPWAIVVRDRGAISCLVVGFARDGAFELQVADLVLARFPARIARIAGGTPVFRNAADPSRQWACALGAIQQAQPDWHAIELDRVVPGGSFQRALTDMDGPVGSLQFVPTGRREKLHRVVTASSVDAYLAAMSGKRRKDFRRRVDKAWSAWGPGTEFVRVTDPADVPTFLADVERIFSRSWQATVVGRYRRDDAGEVEALERLARRGWFRGYVIRTATGPAAFAIGYQFGDTYWFDEQGFDPAYADHSPGLLLSYLVVTDLHAAQVPSVIDFGYGDHQFKRTLGNETLDVAQGWLCGAARWRALASFQNRVYALEDDVRDWLGTVGLDDRVRRWLRALRRGGPVDRTAGPTMETEG